jgi:hypothetical protein
MMHSKRIEKRSINGEAGNLFRYFRFVSMKYIMAVMLIRIYIGTNFSIE